MSKTERKLLLLVAEELSLFMTEKLFYRDEEGNLYFQKSVEKRINRLAVARKKVRMQK